MIKDGIEGVQKRNRKDPNVETAPKSVFEDILNKVQKKPVKQANSGLGKIIQDYRLDIRGLSPQVLQQVQQRYFEDLQNFNKQYANAINNLINQQRR